MNKLYKILLNTVPILVMIGLIPYVPNDYSLAIIYIVLIAIFFSFHKKEHEIKVLLFGAVVMMMAELVFLHTGVETFTRNTLFGLMPIWLPLLWGYAFVAMKRSIKILEL